MNNSKSKIEEKSDEKSYFQFLKEYGHPIFLQIAKGTVQAPFLETLKECGFEELQKKEERDTVAKLLQKPHARILQLKEASPKISLQLGKPREADLYGPESIIPQSHYKIYRFQGLALLIYSFAVTEWELGGIENLGKKEDSFALKTILNRYLSWCLSPLGIVGFWGKMTEKSILLLKQSESKGEVVWLDVKNSKVISNGKVSKIPSPLLFLRPDQFTHRSEQKMNKEELYSFLMERTCYFDYAGPTVPVRQIILSLSQMGVGTYCQLNHTSQNPSKINLAY